MFRAAVNMGGAGVWDRQREQVSICDTSPIYAFRVEHNGGIIEDNDVRFDCRLVGEEVLLNSCRRGGVIETPVPRFGEREAGPINFGLGITVLG